MAFLKPDKIYTLNGIQIKEKLITSKSGVRYYSGRKLNTKNNIPEYLTIHNTPDINEAAGTTDAEQYSRATYNNSMGEVVVHYYIDETDCWHILADDTIGYHAADGANGPGNSKSIAIEIIMDGSGKSYDTQAEERGAKLAAGLLNKYNIPIDKMVPHKKWSGKNCPLYILPHWDKFVNKVKTYYNQINLQSRLEKIPNAQYYKLQLGAFSIKANAVSMVNEIKKKGFDVKWVQETSKTFKIYSKVFNNKTDVLNLYDKLLAAGYQSVINSFNITPGDVDGDGKVTAADSRLILRASTGLETLNDEQLLAADIDKDGKATAADARIAMRKSVGLEK